MDARGINFGRRGEIRFKGKSEGATIDILNDDKKSLIEIHAAKNVTDNIPLVKGVDYCINIECDKRYLNAACLKSRYPVVDGEIEGCAYTYCPRFLDNKIKLLTNLSNKRLKMVFSYL